jgi:hypothetical protein
MPYRIEQEAHGIYKKYTGQVTGPEMLKAVQTVNALPNFHGYRYVINDFLDCMRLDLSHQDKDDAVAAAIGAHADNPKFVAAFVAMDEAILKTLQSVRELANDYLSVAVFTNLKDVRAWAETPHEPRPLSRG